MLESFGLGLKHQSSDSVESFVSPSARIAETPWFNSDHEPSSPLHRLRSSFGRGKKRLQLPPIHPEIVIQTASVNFIRPRLLGTPTCRRIYLTTTKRTLSLHHHPEQTIPFDIIVRDKITHVERVPIKLNCMEVLTKAGRPYYFAFDIEDDLYSWITDLSPATAPTNFRHIVHVEHDKANSELKGLPSGWENEFSLYNMALPEIKPEHFELKRDFNERLSYISNVSVDEFDLDEEEEVAQILSAERVNMDNHLLHVPSRNLALRIITDNLYQRPDRQDGGQHASPSTPALTIDTSPTPITPALHTPFRESPYRYRDSDAEDLTGQVKKLGQWAYAHGGCADIWQAVWQNGTTPPVQVAVKVLRVLNQDAEVREKVLRCEGFGEFPSMVSAWYENGHIMSYLQKLGEMATVQKRLKLLIDVACGLNYRELTSYFPVHSFLTSDAVHTFSFPLDGANIVHGDLKGANILVNANGEAALADFGLSAVIAVAGQPSTFTSNGGGSVRWMAPELLSGSETIIKTCASDIYSFGSVMLEVLTGEKPYKHLINDMQVITAIHQRIKPERPTKPSVEPIWGLMERCWNDEPADRPVMSIALLQLERYYHERKRSIFHE
ncbi:hypothetical protein Clacol_010397 [Clathrus columnatus]|uniref:Uncharacterized protein n=1 Tax=Clathrus columnatus TaxID=1419009 RepID=A0AAV5AQM3_9AGAM|nr:hypothetical protein Clacol_010397 [Clathrus columnatus]